jgi:alpha-maltose-1-phosphate synthase
MHVTYTAPNRGSHYIYAKALAGADCLHKFVCGFPRYSARAPLPEIGNKMLRGDHLQTLYLASLRFGWPTPVSEEISHLSKIWLDHLSTKSALESDVFLYYSGAGLGTTRRAQPRGVACVVEAVNSHARVQERILLEEHERLGLPFRRFHPREMARRIREYEEADAILCPSSFVRDSFIDEGTPPERLFLVPYGASFQDVPLAPPGRDGTFRVLYVGQISVRKGLRYLLEAFEKLHHPAKELWIVGPRTNQTGIESVKVPDNTRFLGVLKGDDLIRAYQSSSVFVLPTVEEGLAHVLGEALSFGLPVVTTVNSGGADLFQDGKEGFLVPIRSPDILAEKMQLLADDPAYRDRMSGAARARAKLLGGWDESGRLLVEALASIAKMPRKAQS